MACGTFLLSTIFGCSSGLPVPPDPTTELTIGMPEGTAESAELGALQQARMLSLEGLTQATVDGRVTPRLAERWEWDEEGVLLRVFLRPNVKFHDGTPLTASLAADVLSGAVSRPANQVRYLSLGDIESIQAAGELELLIRVRRRSAFLPEDLSVPLHLGSDVGTGPFRLVGNRGSDLVLEKFDEYYLGTPSIDRVTIRPFDAMRTTWSSLLRGEVDMVTDVPPDFVEFLRTDEIQVVVFPRWYQFMLAFNSRTRPFSSAMVRRALNIAIDRDALIGRVLKGFGTAASGPIWPRHWAYDQSIKGYAFDPQAATSLLDAAGLRLGAARSESGFPEARFRFKVLLPTNFAILERLALELQRQLYYVDVDMQFEAVPLAEYDQRIRDGKFEAVLVDMISGPTLARPSIFWSSEAASEGLNVFGYSNDEADRLFELLRTSMSETEVRAATTRLQRVLMDDPPALFLAWNERARVIRREFLVYQEPGRDPISSMWRWTTNPEFVVGSLAQ